MSRQVCIMERFEDNELTVLENENSTTFSLPARWLPEEVQEGDVLSLELATSERSSKVSFTIEAELTAERRALARALRASLPQAAEGDIKL